MEDTKDKKNWQLIRTNNGEWISEEYAVFPDKLTACMYQLKASRLGIKLSKHAHYDGTTWYYKHEIEAIDAIVEKKEKEEKPVMTRKLKIAPKKTDDTLDF